MSKKVTDQQNQEATPFFAHLLSTQSDPASMSGSGGPAPTWSCDDYPCTKKYPSDDDDTTTWFGDKD